MKSMLWAPTEAAEGSLGLELVSCNHTSDKNKNNKDHQHHDNNRKQNIADND